MNEQRLMMERMIENQFSSMKGMKEVNDQRLKQQQQQ